MKKFREKCPNCKSKNLMFVELMMQVQIYNDDGNCLGNFTESEMKGHLNCLKCGFKEEAP